MNLKRVFDIIDFQVAHHSDHSLFRYQEAGTWYEWNAADLQHHVRAFAQGLKSQGIGPDSTILIIPKSCHPVALCLDLAAQMLGALPAVAHSTFGSEQMAHVVDELAPSFIFCTQSNHLRGALEAMNKSEANLATKADYDIYQLSCDRESPIYQAFYGGELKPSELFSSDQIRDDQVANIIYTSGSSGRPKGVMLTHRNIMSNLGAMTPLIPISSGSDVVSYLPYSHILERAAVFAYLMMGMRVHVVEDAHHLAPALREIRPIFVTAVPRIIERMAEGFERFRRRRGWWRKKMLNTLISLSQRAVIPGRWQWHLKIVHWLARHFFFRKFRMALGGRMEGMVVGGAHLRPALAQLFQVVGIDLREGYGMTETAPIITINQFKPGLHKIGTVGLPLPNVEIKLREDGEILVKGPNVTPGYYKQPQLTKELFDNQGWLKTGDIGHLTEDGFLVISDRKKEIIKTSAGKYIAPAVLEAIFKASPFINQILIVGFQRAYVSGVLIPNFEVLQEWCDSNAIHWTSPTYMVHNIKVKNRLQQEINVINGRLPKFERLQKYVISAEEWTPENGFLSESYKPMRRVIETRFAKEIDKLYS